MSLSNIKERLDTSATVLLGGAERHGNREANARPEGWARRVLANLSANVANGVPLTEESRQALAEHNAAMSRISVGDLVAVDNSGHVVPSGPFREAVASVVAIGEDGQVQIMPLNSQSRQRLEVLVGSPQRTSQEFLREYQNVPSRPDPNTPGGQARIRREQAMQRNPPPATSELPPISSLRSRQQELIEEEAQRQRENQLLALQELLRAQALAGRREDSPPPPPPNPLQHAIPVLDGRPKRRILRKRKPDDEV